jgi:hypothetical protein
VAGLACPSTDRGSLCKGAPGGLGGNFADILGVGYDGN